MLSLCGRSSNNVQSGLLQIMQTHPLCGWFLCLSAVRLKKTTAQSVGRLTKSARTGVVCFPNSQAVRCDAVNSTVSGHVTL